MTLRAFIFALCLLSGAAVTVAASGRDAAEAAISSPVAVVEGFHASMGRGAPTRSRRSCWTTP